MSSLRVTQKPGNHFWSVPQSKIPLFEHKCLPDYCLFILFPEDKPKDLQSKTGLELITGGGCGNLTERVIYGELTDFFSIGIEGHLDGLPSILWILAS
jgi:lipoprotein signal peptidase